MAEYIFISSEGKIVDREPKGRGRVRKEAIERPEGSGKWWIKFPEGVESIEAWKLWKEEQKPEKKVRPLPTPVVEHVRETEILEPQEPPKKLRVRAIRKLNFPQLRQGLFVSQSECGWLDGWETGHNVFWAENCVVMGKEGIGELMFNGHYRRIEIDFDNDELRIYDYAPRKMYSQDEQYDCSKVVLVQVFMNAVEPCDVDANRAKPPTRLAMRAS